MRWVVAGKEHNEYFATFAQSESFKAELIQARSAGEAFDVESGLPVSKLREQAEKANAVTWMVHAKEYARYKWPRLAGNSRGSVAEVLTTITVTLLPKKGKGRPEEKTLRTALYRWAFNGQKREESPDPDILSALEWADANSPPVGVLADLETMRNLLDACARTLEDKPAAGTYLARRRQVLSNVLKYAVTKKRLVSIPLNDPELNWERPSDMELDHEVDPRCVGGPELVEQLLATVSYLGKRQGPRFVAFFACMFYGMLRPEEVCGLRVQDCELPAKGWGRLVLEKTDPAPGKAWTDSGEVHEERGLKHRSRKTVRPVPIPPELVRLIREHLDRFGANPDGRIFRSVNGKPISPQTYSKVWARTREMGLPPDKYGSVLLKRPYDLRHSGITVRLYAGVPPKQVAQWAGHSVEVLHKTYSQILDGFDDTWFQRIDQVLNKGKEDPEPDEEPPSS
ncbi:MAG: hypothetical protein JWL97_4207 [Gemmatimonadales bacterium]|nr:hypothetical protein [Gemmatimonadales bacterium]